MSELSTLFGIFMVMAGAGFLFAITAGTVIYIGYTLINGYKKDIYSLKEHTNSRQIKAKSSILQKTDSVKEEGND